MAVGAVVDHVPEHEGLLREVLVLDQLGGLLGQLQPEGVHGGLGHRAEAGRLAVAEDRAPGPARGRLTDGDGLGEEDRGVGVVPRGEVLEGDRYEQRVVVPGALQFGEPLRPHHPQRDGFQVAVRVAVLGVHREEHQVLEAVPAVGGRLEGQQGVEEVRHPEAAVGPAAQVGDEGLVVGGVVREQRGELLDRVHDASQGAGGVIPAGRALGLEVDRAVLGLPGPDGLDRLLQHRPLGVVDDVLAGYLAFARRPRRKNFSHDPPPQEKLSSSHRIHAVGSTSRRPHGEHPAVWSANRNSSRLKPEWLTKCCVLRRRRDGTEPLAAAAADADASRHVRPADACAR